MNRGSRLFADPRAAVTILVLAGYVAVSNGVLHLYPFSIFDMYSRQTTSASRVVAREASGHLVEVDRFDRWACEGPIDVAGPREPRDRDLYTIPYKDAEAVRHIDSHRGSDPAAVPVDVVRHIWWLTAAPGAPETEDRLIQRCRAIPR